MTATKNDICDLVSKIILWGVVAFLLLGSACLVWQMYTGQVFPE